MKPILDIIFQSLKNEKFLFILKTSAICGISVGTVILSRRLILTYFIPQMLKKGKFTEEQLIKILF
jgi:hypothetical protein